jgi:hypothetical protein
MLWPLATVLTCQRGILNHLWREASTEEVSAIGSDQMNHVFQVYGADGSGQVVLRKQL